MTSDGIVWRRIDRPGHEGARLLARPSGWQLAGAAVFLHELAGCRLDYLVDCDVAWRTVSARVSGWMGSRTVDLTVAVDAARHWGLNGVDCPDVSGCLDIDLAFSPSTNLLPIRRLNLKAGEARAVRAAWLTFPELTLRPLEQVYRRLDETSYQYESGEGAFTAVLRTNESGFVTHYPELWEIEQRKPAA